MSGKSTSKKVHVVRRFCEQFEVDQSTGCWVWTGAISRPEKGYGRIVVKGKSMMAHRWSYEAYIGPIEGGLLVLHKCDNSTCVNPEHLYLGRQSDNMIDAFSRGRKGLHPDKVRTAKRMFRDGLGTKEVSERLGICMATSSMIKNGKSYWYVD